MKYDKEALSKLSYKDYILLIAEELNKEGFTVEGKPYKVSTNVNGGFVSDFSRALILSLSDGKAISFLKDIGLLNNGRCPLTGLMITESTRMTYTSDCDGTIQFDISNKWKEYNKVKRNWGCFLGIAIIAASIFVAILYGIGTHFYITLGIGLGLVILSSLYAGSKFGNNWNDLCLSNQLGINTVTLLEILKLENKEGISSPSANKYNIPSGDMAEYQKWAYSSNLNL